MSSVPVDANSLFQVPGLVAVITGGGTGVYMLPYPSKARPKQD